MADIWPPQSPNSPLAVLVSGGADSAILLAEAALAYPAVYPLYIRTGLLWEPAELATLQKFLEAFARPSLKPLVVLDQPTGDLFPKHWSLTGENVPNAESEDDAVYLPGRNLLLFLKPMLWCQSRGIPQLATAPLVSNPFPDSTPEFYEQFSRLVQQATGGLVRVLRPYAEMGLHKPDVLRRGARFPLQYTFSCLRPVGVQHCGQCNKCAERHAGFVAAQVPDPTEYRHPIRQKD